MSGKDNNSEKPNPFSFKNYIKTPPPLLPDVNNPIDEANIADEQTADNADKPAVNPFSFKNFITEPTLDENELPDLNLIPPPPPPPPPLNEIPDLEWTTTSVETNINPTSESNVENDSNEEENEVDLVDQLKNEIKQDKKLIARQQEKIVKLEKRIEELIAKEENENTTLELVIQQVEKNLEEAKLRAVASESTVELLKLELAQLKTQIKTLTAENLLLKTYNVNIGKNVFKTIYDIAGQINEAASSADATLKHLNSGVSTLRLIASRLESLEKLTEIVDS